MPDQSGRVPSIASNSDAVKNAVPGQTTTPEPCLNCGSVKCLHAECMAGDFDIVTLPDGRISINGQGHLPAEPGRVASRSEATSCDFYNQNGCTLDADHRGSCTRVEATCVYCRGFIYRDALDRWVHSVSDIPLCRQTVATPVVTP